MLWLGREEEKVFSHTEKRGHAKNLRKKGQNEAHLFMGKSQRVHEKMMRREEREGSNVPWKKIIPFVRRAFNWPGARKYILFFVPRISFRWHYEGKKTLILQTKGRNDFFFQSRESAFLRLIDICFLSSYPGFRWGREEEKFLASTPWKMASSPFYISTLR